MSSDPTVLIFQAWIKNSAETLAALLSQPAVPQAGSSFIVTPSEMTGQFHDGAFHIPITTGGALTGPLILAIDGREAVMVASNMLGEESPGDTFGALHGEVLGEAFRQMVSFLPAALTRALGQEVTVRSTDPSYGALPDLGAPLYVSLEFPVKISKDDTISLYLFLPATLAEELSAAAGPGALANEVENDEDEAEERPRNEAPRAQANVSQANFSALPTGREGPSVSGGALDILLDVPLEVMVVLGKTSLMIEDLLSIGEGSVLELDKMAGEPVELFVHDRLVAYGEVVVVDERFGVKVLEMVSGRPRRAARSAG